MPQTAAVACGCPNCWLSWPCSWRNGVPGVPYTRFWASRRDAEDEPSWQALPLQPPSEAGGEVAATNPWLSQGPAIRHGDGRGGAAPSQTSPGSPGSPHAVCHAFNCPLAGDGLEKKEVMRSWELCDIHLPLSRRGSGKPCGAGEGRTRLPLHPVPCSSPLLPLTQPLPSHVGGSALQLHPCWATPGQAHGLHPCRVFQQLQL